MDPYEERREMKRQKEHYDMLGYVADSQYGIPSRCPCGSMITDEVVEKEEYDTFPGKRYFSCKNYKDDGLHFRHPWVCGVQEEIQNLTKRVGEVEKETNHIANLNFVIETLAEQVQSLTVKVAHLEKLCFE